MVNIHSKKQKRLNKNKKTHKNVGGGCGCNNGLFKGGSTQLNNQYGTKQDPLTSFNIQNTRLSPQSVTTPTNLFGGKKNRKKKQKSKKIKGGNINYAVDKYLNNALTNNSLRSAFGYQNIPTKSSLV